MHDVALLCLQSQSPNIQQFSLTFFIAPISPSQNQNFPANTTTARIIKLTGKYNHVPQIFKDILHADKALYLKKVGDFNKIHIRALRNRLYEYVNLY